MFCREDPLTQLRRVSLVDSGVLREFVRLLRVAKHWAFSCMNIVVEKEPSGIPYSSGVLGLKEPLRMKVLQQCRKNNNKRKQNEVRF